MSQNFRTKFVFFLVILVIGFISGNINLYAKNDKVILGEKYNTKQIDRIKSSINQKNNYRFLINTTDSLETVTNYFSSIDKKIKIKEYSNGNYMIKLPKNAPLINKTDIDNGILPTTIGKYNVVQPEIVEGFGYLDGEKTTQLWGNTKVGAELFQEELSLKEKIKVGILDTGIDYNHIDLDANYNQTLSYDFVNEDTDALDDNGHGTGIAGIIGAEVNGVGRYGVNSNSDLVSLKVLDANGIGTSYDILDAIEYAKINGIKVLNLSFGGIGNPESSVICSAISNAKNNGIFIVVSAGNINTGIDNIIPAGCSDSITVGSINNLNEKASFSNYGKGVIYAPGVDIYSTDLNNSYKIVEGTSFSAGFVSGLISKELALSGIINYNSLIENINKNYNLLSSIFTPSINSKLNIFTGSGEVLMSTGDDLVQTIQESGVFSAESNSYPYNYSNNGVNDCNRIEEAFFSNGYSLKQFTLAQDFTKNVGRTELYKDGVLVEYQDNVFFSTPGTPWFSGNSCYLNSRFRSVILRDNGVIDIDYYFWDGFKSNYGVKPTKFNINKKNITNISASTSVFGYPKHFYIKLNLFDNNISSTINIASQGFFDSSWQSDYASNGSWLWGGIGFGTKGCIINSVTDNELNYLVNYDCTVYKYRSGGAANGGGYTDNKHVVGNFYLDKKDYDLCSYNSQFCINNFSITKLFQEIQSPYLEKQEVKPGEKIGKFQSGSGIILSVNLKNENQLNLKFAIEIYKLGESNPFYTNLSDYSTGSTNTLTIPYLGKGDYYWKSRIENENGISSEWQDFGTDNLWEVDYSIFEGFEPYPYGYSFPNSSPVNGILTGGISGFSLLGYDNRKKIPGIKWDVFNKIFPEKLFHTDKKMFDAFESFGLNNINPALFYGGNCLGLSLSSITYNNYFDSFNSDFTDFVNLVGNGNIWSSIDISKDGNGYWNNINETQLKTILTFQLINKWKPYNDEKLYSYNNYTSTGVLEDLKNNIDGNYILSVSGRKNKFSNIESHAIVPYKVEGNRIYIWENNVPYPNDFNNLAYNQYIEVLSNGSWYNKYYNTEFGWNYFDKLLLINVDNLYNQNNNVAMGFSGNDKLYTLSGKSDLLLIDSFGRKTGFSDGHNYEEIPGTMLIIDDNGLVDGYNLWKQIYIPEKIDGLSIEVNGKETENYDLMIAGGDYYTKLSGVSTGTGETDIYKISREQLQIDFDDNKILTRAYNLLIDNFQNNGTGTIYRPNMNYITGLQQFNIDWGKVVNNNSESVKYQIDSDNDGFLDIESYFNSIPNKENELGNISGYIKGDTNAKMAGWKVFLDENEDGALQENQEKFVITDNNGYYEFNNLESKKYNVIEIPHQNWEVEKGSYKLYLNSGQKIKNLNFNNIFLKGK